MWLGLSPLYFFTSPGSVPMLYTTKLISHTVTLTLTACRMHALMFIIASVLFHRKRLLLNAVRRKCNHKKSAATLRPSMSTDQITAEPSPRSGRLLNCFVFFSFYCLFHVMCIQFRRIMSEIICRKYIQIRTIPLQKNLV